MHVLGRNLQDVWYANPVGKTMVTDSNGLKTGTYTMNYGVPVKLRMSVATSSGANNLGSQGMAELHAYGITTGYTHRFVTNDMQCPITEESIIWYKSTPGETYDAVPHNFVVTRRSPSLNHVTYYVQEVDAQ